MTGLAQARRPSFSLVLVGSYALAAATAIALSITWIEEVLWVGGLVFVGWLATLAWAFSKFGGKAAWTLLGLLFVNPVTLFAGGVTYACAAKAACF